MDWIILIYAVIAIFIAWIWVDYYRLIDVFEPEKLGYFIIIFVLGGLSVYPVLYGYSLYGSWSLNGDGLNDFLYSTFGIGLLEELGKTLPFLVMLLVFRKQFSEPIDFLAFICVSALGFSAAENVLYFKNHGPQLINGRAILSTVGHMFDTSMIAYGIIRYQYRYHNWKGLLGIVFFVFLAALSHGIYDFWLLFEGTKEFGWLLTVIYFFLTISIFATILNNALNNSPHFTYKRVVDSDKVSMRLLLYYGIVFAVQFVFIGFYKDFNTAVWNLLGAILMTGIIIVVTILRLSRFTLIQNRWFPIKAEFPFHVGRSSVSQAVDGNRTTNAFAAIRVKGQSYNESLLHQFYQEYALIYPVSKKRTQLGGATKIYIEQKHFTPADEALFSVRIYASIETESYEIIHIRAKTGNVSFVDDKYPIVSIIRQKQNEANTELNLKHFLFQEWAYITPFPKQTNS